MASSAGPETRYAKSGDVHVAYQVVGDGPLDLIFAPGFASHLEYQWEEPLQARFFSRLASFARLIRFDKRGTGLSDPVPSMPTFEERIDDLRAVMDAAGSERATLIGLSEGGAFCTLFAAAHPERVGALVLLGAFARLEHAEDFPAGADPEALDQFAALLDSAWGSGIFDNLFTTSLADDPRFHEWWTRFERLALSPGTATSLFRIYRAIDIRSVLPVIRVPTLVLQAIGDPLAQVDHGRYLAEHIPGARLVEFAGQDHYPWREGELIAGEVEEFLTGERTGIEPDRVLATILFSDIVGSTERATELATGAGAICSTVTTRWCAASLSASGAVRSRRLATASSPYSTARLARFIARARSGMAPGRSASRFGSGSTLGRSKSAATISAASRSTSPAAWSPPPNPTKSSSPEPWSTSSPAPTSPSPTVASTTSKASPPHGTSTPPTPDPRRLRPQPQLPHPSRPSRPALSRAHDDPHPARTPEGSEAGVCPKERVG